jgi:hypothetical protein
MFRSYAGDGVKTYRNANLGSKLEAALAENKSIGKAEVLNVNS